MNPFLRQPSAYQRTPLRAERPNPKTVDDGVVTLRLYDPIDSWGGFWGLSAKEFTAVLDELPDDTKEVRLLVNSPGGECWDGLAILNALRNHPARVVAVVEGIAASAASFIACGVDELQMMPNSELFVHRAWGLAIGDAPVMEKAGADLTHEDRNLAAIYAGKAGGTVDDWLAVMTADTFYSADEAVEAGLADGIVKPAKGAGKDGAAEAKARFDLSVFASMKSRDKPAAPRAQIDPDPEPEPEREPDDIPEPEDVPAAEPEPITDPKEEDPVSTLSTDVRSRLGLTDDAEDDAVLASLDALKVKAETPTPDPTMTAKAEATAAENAELRKEVGVLASRVEEMSAELATTKAEKVAATKAAVLDEAQRQGKFKPADRAQWEADYDEAPAAISRTLARIAPGTEVPVQPAGHAGTGDENSDAAFWAQMDRLDGAVTKGA